MQWPVLLVASVTFYLLGDQVWLLIFPVGTGTVCYVGGRVLAWQKERKRKKGELRLTLVLTLCGTIGVLFALKYVNFIIYTYNGIVALFQGLPPVGSDLSGGINGSFNEGLVSILPDGVAVLGISFYTLSMLGYVIDIYYEIGQVSRNYFKFLLYGLFFPTMISGPVMRYSQMAEELYQPHSFDYKRITRGFQRMLWGFFKKLVISERAALVVNTVFNDHGQYEGAFYWLAAMFFVIQLYTDFSGCMDIVLGIGETFGINMPENFRTPFLSRSISEYWRRWHITLGAFMKDYVFFPLLRSGMFNRLGQFLR
ncbi:MAG: MBOAT family protein, partial [Lachnospiraceae bacterium]|nr:MBOAT family protein [Lachnospiraceae bacterium]